ncbi:3166_t:CDS:1 [Dentiscutata heterogama]|uniref:3166_t:CDS:1 n=1 Tax=Dentiscutata heterogama TaxID=1316150 RepID=A0ACA9M3K3_9GLOM|nr:3166_t:CDS:1 [Dentiscutata heterogama]
MSQRNIDQDYVNEEGLIYSLQNLSADEPEISQNESYTNQPSVLWKEVQDNVQYYSKKYKEAYMNHNDWYTVKLFGNIQPESQNISILQSRILVKLKTLSQFDASKSFIKFSVLIWSSDKFINLSEIKPSDMFVSRFAEIRPYGLLREGHHVIETYCVDLNSNKPYQIISHDDFLMGHKRIADNSNPSDRHFDGRNYFVTLFLDDVYDGKYTETGLVSAQIFHEGSFVYGSV